jgi:hypothetical protein
MATFGKRLSPLDSTWLDPVGQMQSCFGKRRVERACLRTPPIVTSPIAMPYCKRCPARRKRSSPIT